VLICGVFGVYPQPHGLSCRDNVIKECEEEASIPRHIAETALPVSAVSYESSIPEGVKRDVLFVYDLRLSEDFVPEPMDGEVEGFQRLPIDAVAEIIYNTTDFKPNCALVVLDFMVRHGVLRPEQKGYLDLLRGLRAGDCS
jgi:hypothetical protein